MKLSQLNDYFQTLATVGAIAGLLLVAYQVAQTNAISEAQNISANWSLSSNNRTAWLDSGVAETIAKSLTEPESLTLADKIELDLYLQTYAIDWTHAIWTGDAMGSQPGRNQDEAFTFLLEIAAAEAPQVFGSKFARGWLKKNQGKGFLQPYLYEAFERGLEGVSTEAILDYYNDIDELAGSFE